MSQNTTTVSTRKADEVLVRKYEKRVLVGKATLEDQEAYKAALARLEEAAEGSAVRQESMAAQKPLSDSVIVAEFEKMDRPLTDAEETAAIAALLRMDAEEKRRQQEAEALKTAAEAIKAAEAKRQEADESLDETIKIIEARLARRRQAEAEAEAKAFSLARQEAANDLEKMDLFKQAEALRGKYASGKKISPREAVGVLTTLLNGINKDGPGGPLAPFHRVVSDTLEAASQAARDEARQEVERREDEAHTESERRQRNWRNSRNGAFGRGK